MKTRSLVMALLSAASIAGAASAAYGQANGQAGGLPALAAEVAELRAMLATLQEQVGNGAEPYSGTYTVTMVETSLFGCRQVNAGPPAGYVGPYFLPLTNSSISVRSAMFEVEADGTVLHVPDFELETKELRLSGYYEPYIASEDGADIVIAGDGSMHAVLDDSTLTGQFASDGSMFSALVVGEDPTDVPGSCDDAWTVSLTGVRR